MPYEIIKATLSDADLPDTLTKAKQNYHSGKPD